MKSSEGRDGGEFRMTSIRQVIQRIPLAKQTTTRAIDASQNHHLNFAISEAWPESLRAPLELLALKFPRSAVGCGPIPPPFSDRRSSP